MKTKKVMTMLTMLTVVLVSWVGCNKKEDDPGVALKVMSTNPITNAVGVAVNSKVSAKFSAGLDAASVTSTSFTLMQGTTAVAGVVTVADSTATFTPSASLPPTVVYTATLKTTIRSSAGKNLATEYTWSFTSGATPDTTKPTVTLSEPAADATAVALNRTVIITFSEPMDQTTLNATNITLKQGTTVVAGAVTSTSTKATFTPAVSLEGSKVYTATVSGVKDVAGNMIAANYTFSFTTVPPVDVTPPTVTLVDPLNNATGVPLNKIVKITFSEAMDATSISGTTVTLKQGTTSVAGAVTYAANVATFTPTTPLVAATLYTVTVSTGAKDAAGNALATNFIAAFTTGGSSAPLAVVNLGSSANYVILAKTAITNNPASAITGDLGLSPAAESYITGFSLTAATGYATSSQVTGKVYAADQASPTPTNLTTAVGDMITAYNDAAGRPSPDFLELATGNIGGKTLTAGLYKWTNTVTMPADVTISGGANDVWIFQIAGDLSMSNAVKITLVGGAQAKNVFWQVAGTVTVGTTAQFKGIILSQTGITFQTGSSLIGRALAQTAVVLDGSTITKPN